MDIGRVLLILQDGRAIVVCLMFNLFFLRFTVNEANRFGWVKGIMAGFDQKSNVVLSDSKERVYSMEEGVEEIPLGLYLVKGDMMCVTPTALTLQHAY